MALSFQNGVAYQEVKPQDADSLPIILVHGAGSSHLGWPSGIRHLPGRHIFAIDLPNHGKSAKKELNSIEEYALDLQVFLDSLGIEKANLVGYSMGSAIVLQILFQNPAFCAQIALLAYTPDPVFEEFYEQELPEQINRFDWVQSFTQKLFQTGFSEAQKGKVGEPLFHADRETLKNDLLITHQYCPVYPERKCTVPALFLLGENDPFSNPVQKQNMIDHFSTSSVKTLAHAGHLFIWEYPEMVGGYLSDFFKS